MVIGHWKNAINLMHSTDETGGLAEFFDVNNRLDNMRDESFKDVFPDLYSRLKEYDK
jgi:hypothetical protein